MTQPSTGLPGFPALAAVIGRMEAVLAQLREHRDPRRFFHAAYLRTTRAVGAELAAGGFLDAAWVERWDVAFAGFYLDALESGLRGERVPGSRAAAFGAVAPVPAALGAYLRRPCSSSTKAAAVSLRTSAARPAGSSPDMTRRRT